MTWSDGSVARPLQRHRVPVAAYLLAVAVFLILLPYPRRDGHLISSDGAYYFSYLRSAVLDGDLDLANDIALYNSRMVPGDTSRLSLHWAYAFSVGPAIANAPGYLLARAVVATVHAAGGHVASDGFSYVEETAFCIGNLTLGFLGLAFLGRALLLLFPTPVAERTMAVMIFGTSAVAYLYLETWMSHAPELLGVGLCAWCAVAVPRGTAGWFAAGMAAGLAFLMRWQNLVWLAPLLVAAVRADAPGRGNRIARPAVRIGASLAGALLVAVPQLLFWQAVFGSPFVVPQGAGFMTAGEFHGWETLFSTRHGLIVWTPVVIPALAGLFLARPRTLGWTFSFVFLLQWIISSSTWQWWAGYSFGMRRLVGAVPVFALGLASMHFRLRGTRFMRLFTIVEAACVVWTLAFFAQYALNLIPRDGYLTFGQVVTDKLLLPITAVGRVLQ